MRLDFAFAVRVDFFWSCCIFVGLDAINWCLYQICGKVSLQAE